MNLRQSPRRWARFVVASREVFETERGPRRDERLSAEGEGELAGPRGTRRPGCGRVARALGECASDVVRRGGDLDDAHAALAARHGADGNVDSEDAPEQPVPR